MNWPIALGILLKPKVILAMALLYITTFASSVLKIPANPLDFQLFTIGLLAVIISVSGANALNCYYDRDIDSIMARTQGRRLAMDVVGANQTQNIGLILMVLASGISINLGLIPFFTLSIGAGFYILLYTILLKRRTILNIVATLPSIASPAFLGWYLGGAPILPAGIVVMLLITIWGPLHLWTLAYSYSKDYNRIEVPMLTSVLDKSKASKAIIMILITQVISSYILMLWTKTLIYPVGISIINSIILEYGYNFYRNKSNKGALKIFKLTAPYIIMLLLVFALDHFL